METILMYADESCHIKNDGNDIMSLVTVYIKESYRPILKQKIYDLKLESGFSLSSELKWNKITDSNSEQYINILSVIADSADKNFLRIRSLCAKNKTKIKMKFNDWYNSMYFTLFKKIVTNDMQAQSFRFFIDIKDTNSVYTLPKIGEYLENYAYWNNIKIEVVPSISSEHILIQIADIFAGAISYKNRNLKSNFGKLKVINYIEDRFGVNLSKSSYYSSLKFNNFIWEGKNGDNF